MPRTSRLLTVALVAALGVVTPAPAHAADPVPDPTAAGPHTVTAIEYNAGPTVVVGGLEVWTDSLRGALFVPSGPGPFPVLLVLHGKDRDCQDKDDVVTLDPSEPFDVSCGFTPRFPLHRGFDYLTTNLASHGYLVVSVLTHAGSRAPSGGGFTDSGAYARAEILARTLDLLSEWNVRPGPGDVGTALLGRVDLSRIGAMGHSRGGEGVTELIDHAQERPGAHYRLSGVIAIASTETNPRTPHGVPYANIVPPCDGDVKALDSAYLYDRGRFVDPTEPAPRMLFVVRGANHNFFQTLWQDTDDGLAADGGCDHYDLPPSPHRLTYADQQRIGLALVAAFFRRYVGAETAFEPLLTGAATLPATACPFGQATCPDAVGVSYLAPAAQRAVVLTGDSLAASDPGGPVVLTGFAEARVCQPTPNYAEGWPGRFVGEPDVIAGVGDPWFALLGQPNPAYTVIPPRTDWCPTTPTRSAARQVALRWDGTASLSAGLTSSAVGSFDASRFTTLTFRTGVNVPLTGSPPPAIDVVLHDVNGKTATVAVPTDTAALVPPEGAVEKRLLLNGVRLPLRAFHGIRLEQLTRVEFRFGRSGPGSVQLAEVAFQVS